MKKFMAHLLNLFGLKCKAEEPLPTPKTVIEEQPEPKRNKISKEPIMGIKDGYLVMVVQYTFDNIPSWVEWDNERKTVTITEMNGDINEADIDLKSEHVDRLNNVHKLLLVSNNNEEQIIHYVQFLARA